MRHQETLRTLVDELVLDETIQAIIVFGSVARGEEQARSDIDVWVIRDTNDFTRRQPSEPVFAETDPEGGLRTPFASRARRSICGQQG